jgi:bifunctional non-homologous end joining protein LigD
MSQRNRDGVVYWAHACRNHWAGVIAKRADAPYQSGRTVTREVAR